VILVFDAVIYGPLNYALPVGYDSDFQFKIGEKLEPE